jgi:ribosomal protein S27AE
VQNWAVKNIDISNATCALCGAGIHIDDHEGRVACDGCGMATDNCTCTGEDLQERAGRSKARGAPARG